MSRLFAPALRLGASLRVIRCNPLAVRESPDKRQAHLSLVWNRERTLGKGNRNRNPVSKPIPIPPPPPPEGISLRWFERRGGLFDFLALVAGVIATLIGVGFFFGSWYIKSDLQATLQIVSAKLDTTITSIGSLGNKVDGIEERLRKLENTFAKVEERVASIERRLDEYRAKATSLGVPAPQDFRPVSLVPNSPPQQIISGSAGQVSYNLEFLLKKVTPEYISFVLSGTIKMPGTSMDLKDNREDVVLRDDAAVNLALIVKHMTGVEIPDVWVVIVDRPSKDKAIIAVGPKTSAV